jgi:hypothetical protein
MQSPVNPFIVTILYSENKICTFSRSSASQGIFPLQFFCKAEQQKAQTLLSVETDAEKIVPVKFGKAERRRYRR